MRFKQKVSPTLTLPTKTAQQGFTLIEIIVGIVVLSIAFSIFTTLIYPLANQTAKQVHQIKAAELGQSMINEIMAKAFDEKSDPGGGIDRCGETVGTPPGLIECTTVLKNEENDIRADFDDVDDYHNLAIIGSLLSTNGALEDLYLGYKINVNVINDSDYDGDNDTADNIYTAKLITVTVTTPQDFDFIFAVYRVNF